MFWIIGAIFTYLFMINASAGLLADWVVIFPFIFATIPTILLWGFNKEAPKTSLAMNHKQGDNTAYTMALLMEMMDEDEREEFKSQLKRRILSGETITDESLIIDIEKRKRG